jgi:hypothetical protein
MDDKNLINKGSKMKSFQQVSEEIGSINEGVKEELRAMDSGDASNLKDWYFGLTDGLYDSAPTPSEDYPAEIQKSIDIIEKARKKMIVELKKESLGRYL